MKNNLKNFYKKFSDQNRNTLSVSVKQRVKEKVFQNLSKPMEEPILSFSIWTRLSHSVLLKSYVLVPLVLLFFVISTTAVSANALPGDILYSVKRQVESARVLLASSPEAKLELELGFAEERLREFEKVGSSAVSENIQTTSEQGQAQTENIEVPNDRDKNNPDSKKLQKFKSTIEASQNTSVENERKLRARREAEEALEFLEKTKNAYTERKEIQHEEEMAKKIENYRKRLFKNREDDSGHEDSENDNDKTIDFQTKKDEDTQLDRRDRRD